MSEGRSVCAAVVVMAVVTLGVMGLLVRWWEYVLCTPHSYGHIIIKLLLACALVVLAYNALCLTGRYSVVWLRQRGRPWILPIWYAVRSTWTAIGLVGLILAIAVIGLLGSHVSGNGRYSAFVWYGGLLSTAGLVVWFLAKSCSRGKKRRQ